MHSLKISRFEERFKEQHILEYFRTKFRIPSKFADKLTVKARGEKAWILYEFPFSLTLICMKYFCNVTA